MNQQLLTNAVSPDHLVVLRAMAGSDMATASVLTLATSLPVLAVLPKLIEEGYVKEHTVLQRGGRPTSLFSLTALGEAIVRAADEGLLASGSRAVTPARTESPSAALYQGHELRPYSARAGAMAAFAHPSRVGAYLHHPDGSITPIE